MSSNRSRTDTIILVLLFLVVTTIYTVSFFNSEVKAVGFNNFVTNVRLLVDRTWGPFLYGSFITIFLESIFPHRFRSYLLAGSGIKPVINSIWMGFFSNRCVYQHLNLSTSMHRSGMSLGASMAYLFSAPVINPISLVMIISLYGLYSSGIIFITVAMGAFVLGLIADFLVAIKFFPKPQIISRTNPTFSIWIELSNYIKNLRFLDKNSLFLFFKNFFSRWFIFVRFNLKWFLLAVVLAGLFAGGFSEGHLEIIFGASFISIIILIFLSAILELHTIGAIIFSYFFFHQTGALGNVILFLSGMFAFEYLEIGLMKKIYGWKLSAIFLLFTLIFLFFVAYTIN